MGGVTIIAVSDGPTPRIIKILSRPCTAPARIYCIDFVALKEPYKFETGVVAVAPLESLALTCRRIDCSPYGSECTRSPLSIAKSGRPLATANGTVEGPLCLGRPLEWCRHRTFPFGRLPDQGL